MTWTALFFNKTTVVFNTDLNDFGKASAIAKSRASDNNTEVVCIIKGDCKNNAYFL